MAIFCELMLRGPQTVGEVRSHTERMSIFERLEEVESTLHGLSEHDPPLALKMPREPGRKECRYRHLFSGGWKPCMISAKNRQQFKYGSSGFSVLPERTGG